MKNLHPSGNFPVHNFPRHAMHSDTSRANFDLPVTPNSFVPRPLYATCSEIYLGIGLKAIASRKPSRRHINGHCFPGVFIMCVAQTLRVDSFAALNNLTF